MITMTKPLAPPDLRPFQFTELDHKRMQQFPGYYFWRAHQVNGSIFQRTHPDGDSFVVMSGVEANRFMTQEGGRLIVAREIRREQNEELGVDETLVSMGGEQHYHHRRLQKAGYSRSVLNDKYTTLVELVEAQVREWPTDAPFRPSMLLPPVVAEMLGVGVLGHSTGGLFPEIAYFVRNLTIETVAHLRPRTVLDTTRYKIAKARALGLANNVIKSHRTGSCPFGHSQLVDDLLSAQHEQDTLMSEQELRVAVLGGYIGGLDTVAYTCLFILYALLKQPHLMAQVVADIDANATGDTFAPSDLRAMNCLHAATLEALRLYPVSSATMCTVAEPFEFAGYGLDEGQRLLMAGAVPHFSEEYFERPFEYRLDRGSEYRQPGAFAPFGVGPHVCLGAGMAEVLIMLTMIGLLRSFKIELADPDYELRIHTMPTPMPAQFHLNISAR